MFESAEHGAGAAHHFARRDAARSYSLKDERYGHVGVLSGSWYRSALIGVNSVVMRACVVVPAYQAEASLARVLSDLAAALPDVPVYVVDDGSTDRTREVARGAGVTVLSHPDNRGKGAALITGLSRAHADGFEAAISVDADGQHPAVEAARMHAAEPDARVLVLGVRDLVRDGAPRKNRFSNGVSNRFLSLFSGRRLRDTQCGLRRYPLPATLGLFTRASGYAFEAEVILRCLVAGLELREVDVEVYYPPVSERVTHFDSVRDPARIVATVVRTLADMHVVHRKRARTVQPVER